MTLEAAEPSTDIVTERLRQQIQERLLAWSRAHRRHLPWRGERDPYRIWVSEVMLQQTRVETVIPYYRHFLSQFPTLPSLAEAELDEVLKAWEGLGYYARARNLHRAAQQVMENHGGQLPADRGALLALPGIGPYTVGAILSLAFGQDAACWMATSAACSPDSLLLMTILAWRPPARGSGIWPRRCFRQDRQALSMRR